MSLRHFIPTENYSNSVSAMYQFDNYSSADCVAEFDRPQNLLSDPNSMFYAMVSSRMK